MDKDHERERKHQQQNERQQEIVIATSSVDEHFEESLRRAKEKQQQSRTQWGPLPLSVHPSSIGHPSMLPLSMIGTGAPPSVMQSSQGSISVTRTDMNKGNSGNLSLTNQQLFEVQRKHALGIPPNYQPDRSRKEYEQQQERLRPVPNDHTVTYLLPHAAWTAKSMEEENKRQAAAQHQKQLQYAKYQNVLQTQMQPQQAPSSKSQVADRYKLKSDTSITPMPGYPFSSFYKDPKGQIKSDHGLPNPPPLMSDIHNSQSGVIVKHDAKTPQKNQIHQPYSSFSASSSHHPGYDYPPTSNTLNNSDRYGRPITSISPSPHTPQQPIQSPQQNQRQTPPTSSYNMIVMGGTKQKVSSPAPSHIYGKPSPDSLHSSVPHNRTQEVSHPNTKPLFQPQIQQMYGPPLAYSCRPITTDPKQIYSVPTTARPPSHPMPISGIHYPLSSSPLPPPESHTSGVSPHQSFSPSPKLQTQMVSGPPSVPEQTQPLDLGVASSSKSRGEDATPRRKASTPFPVTSMIEPKKMRTEPPSPTPMEIQDSGNLINKPLEHPPMSVSPIDKKPKQQENAHVKVEPIEMTSSPKSTTPGLKSSPDTVIMQNISVTTSSNNSSNNNATNNNNNSSNNNNNNSNISNNSNNNSSASSSPVPVTSSTQSTAVEPPKITSSFTAPRHLKKAWLQRHTGEDSEDTTGVVGSGNCIKLPLKLENAGNLVTGNGKEEPVANNVKEEKNSVSENKLVQMKKGSPASNNVQANSNNNRDETGETDQKEASGSDIESESEKNSDTDKESVSGKSDSGTKRINNGTRHSQYNKEPRKRGRRPKQSKEELNSSKKKQLVAQIKNDNDPFCKPPIQQLKKTGEPFLQDGPCFEVAPKLAKCRECRWTPNQRSKSVSNIFCRFYAFRKLKYNKNGQLAIAGFSDPLHDPKDDDLKLWMPDIDSPPPELDLQISRFLLAQVADQFCDLLQQEHQAIEEHMSDDKTVAWKRVVQGVREMCDVCETTLFNYHWVCEKCGFVVCIDCYKSRKQGSVKLWSEPSKERDDFSWLLCTNRGAHDQEKLMLTQIIAGTSLDVLGKQAHELRALWNIPQYCGCPLSKEPPPKATKGFCKEYIDKLLKNEMSKTKSSNSTPDTKNNSIKVENDNNDTENQNSPLTWLADVALKQEPGLNGFEAEDKLVDKDLEDDDGHSALRDLLTRPSNKNKDGTGIKKPPKKAKLESVDVSIKNVIGKYKKGEEEIDITNKSVELKHFIGKNRKKRSYFPVRVMTLVESSLLYPNVPHQWLCDGKLLRLLDPAHVDNFKIFQEQWKRGQPVICSEVSKKLNMNLWTPDSFTRDFGEDKNDLINCMSGNIVPNQQMKKFWEGFDHLTRRLKDDKGEPMLLKLKDWPPGEDFAEILPTRFTDLMKSLPLGDYTQREGKLNLASRLPECFVRPDLGPKMYNAYGSALYPTKGTTNLHLDVSDAVNVMVYVGIPRDGNADEHIKEAFRAIDDAGCDILTRRRVREKNELPGALWHIYAAKDADKIRDLLNKVAIEKGERLEPDHDPIHDQSWYLDGPLRERLYKEYGVEGYPIVQCLGDAVFVPAGAPHQVRNLHNCIKVAEDFVSPENVSHSFHLTQEFRELSDTHSNHEDKLQIKNIIYHAIKDAIACLSHLVSNEISESQSSSVTYPINRSPTSSSNNSLQSSTITTSVKLEPGELIKEESNN